MSAWWSYAYFLFAFKRNWFVVQAVGGQGKVFYKRLMQLFCVVLAICSPLAESGFKYDIYCDLKSDNETVCTPTNGRLTMNGNPAPSHVDVNPGTVHMVVFHCMRSVENTDQPCLPFQGSKLFSIDGLRIDGHGLANTTDYKYRDFSNLKLPWKQRKLIIGWVKCNSFAESWSSTTGHYCST